MAVTMVGLERLLNPAILALAVTIKKRQLWVKKMVTGEKAEPTPIEGKRGSIPVNVQAAHDDANLFLRFEWEDTAHVAVPFVDGGKMDPENPMKLAVMLATDDLKYADQAGCWGDLPSRCSHHARHARSRCSRCGSNQFGFKSRHNQIP